MKHFFSFTHKLFLGFFLLFFSSIFIVFALDVVSTDFSSQPATSSGSNNSTVWFSTGWLSLDETVSGTTSYINKDNDSDTIGNYLRGYYYDTQFGFFRLDWNLTDTTQNVRIISSTDKCGTGYGYKFGGYAYGEAGGYIKFDYNNDIFVYYCESDDKLHGYAYSEHTGFQNFEGLSFEVVALSQNTSNLPSGSGDPFFVNNTSLILIGLSGRSTDIQGESVANQKWREVIFYIVK
ncbi:MAG: hypothetical protein ACD_71C00010G0003 [uncultured bacterium (gcode 4)]|uniref:Uncharacterized protein n=1 Tax=uncultured bacterium (gcode 4) TaxID=1234023 RepID=K1Z6C3_9BACT|nr:MAG: hypothetical protein ACD_71C00010G0003 [uncultured bacterium (gcode 4)]